MALATARLDADDLRKHGGAVWAQSRSPADAATAALAADRPEAAAKRGVEASNLLPQVVAAFSVRVTIRSLVAGKEAPGATVTVGGRERGKTPLTVLMAKGRNSRIELVLEKDGILYATAAPHEATQAGSNQLKLTLEKRERIVIPDLKLTLLSIRAGKFLMGSPPWR